ncbi:TIGR03086 family metal-binding protein [Streptomyces sp. NBC_00452]|uniref:TIGR03086 family metal-binding protein n=1 Tax=Streptomyces sp. NBC_00452 TaxID=2975746 RepID=UPI002253F31C|nr:TIGR03086 family metal-binding protein [Streptomyces sp. NBC_00452]MCX5062078.1 TIGR03086 family metal-binding protein [Streptomyces sp. NBC_00452]
MTVTGADIVEWDRIAVREAVRVVDLARDEDWERDTPCAGWDLRRLVAHMAAQHHGFAAAARGAGKEAAHWREPENMREPGQVHRVAAAAVLDAFGEPGAREREFVLPELGGGFPGRTAISFHFVDYVVHAWDVAAALGVEVKLADDVLGAALAVARLVPTDPARRGPGFAFAPALEVPTGAGVLEEALRLLGRAPEQWSGTAL